jgi:TPR repeat protein
VAPKATENGDPEAPFVIDTMYKEDRGVPQDHKKKLEWYQKAAINGNIDAQYILGTMYDEGIDVPQDYTLAMKWYREAGSKNHAGARKQPI